MAIPRLLRKNKDSLPAITGEPTEEDKIKEEIVEEEVEDTSYEPDYIDEDEINDIGDQLADYILKFTETQGCKPIPGDIPLNLARAAELSNIATTGQHVGYLMMKQEECDKLEAVPWWIKYWQLLIIGGAFLCLPAIILVLGYAGINFFHH